MMLMLMMMGAGYTAYLVLREDDHDVVGDDDDEKMAGENVVFADSEGVENDKTQRRRERVVILGTGWAAISMFKRIDLNKYDVVVVSPRNYFLFTPLMHSATVGSVKGSSLAESVRMIMYGRDKGLGRAQFFEAQCMSVDFESKKIHCQDMSAYVEPGCEEFDLSYDKLVVAVGATNNTFGVPGVHNNSYFFKDLEDAQKIRERLIDVLESNAYPSDPQSAVPADRTVNLCIVGGGPAGVGLASELADFVEQDVKKHFPHVKAHVTIIDALDHLLNTYSSEISKYTHKKFEQRGDIMKILTGSQVMEVKPRSIVVKDRKSGEVREVPSQFTCWATGIATNDLATRIVQQLGENQKNRRAITVDDRLRVKGAKDVFAMGDCSTVEKRLMIDKIVELYDEIDTDKRGTVTVESLTKLFKSKEQEYPQIRAFGDKLFASHKLAKLLGTKDNGVHKHELTRDEFKNLVQLVDQKLTMLPPTAQVAEQQGIYLARALNKTAGSTKDFKDEVAPFEYRHLVSFAYVGQHDTVADLKRMNSTGWFTWALWRGVYFSRQVSLRARANLTYDWVNSWVFGRDMSRRM